MTDDRSSDLSGYDGRIAVLGAGVMGGAVLSGMLAAGLSAERVVVADAAEEIRRAWSEQGIEVAEGVDAVQGADIVLVAVKPHLVVEVLKDVADSIDGVVVSLAAGVRVDTMEEALGEGAAVMRVMPNTPALVGEGMFVITPNGRCSDTQVDTVTTLLRACGETEVVPESQQDVATALSGSGPAYLFYVADALIDGGVLEGLSRPVATRLVEQTLYGAASMLRDGDTPAAILRERVTSPGGTTAHALRALDEGAVRHHLSKAVSAGASRATEMGG